MYFEKGKYKQMLKENQLLKTKLEATNDKFETALETHNTLKNEIAALNADKLRLSLEIKELESSQSQL